ncbi:MAG TPA: helix-turn-helix domain-containing protein, partial [Kofleriaceae bacterium]|nr:helix-turn-helix domain-containing protein [Kofleriaceae bacterium]
MSEEAQPERPWWEVVPLPVMLQEARRAYGQRIRILLAESGLGELPRHGARVLGALRNREAPVRDAAELGVPAGSAPRVVDALVELGHVERVPAPDAPG